MAKDIPSQLASLEAELVAIAVRRLDACIFTVATVHSELIEPSDVQLKADMLIAAEELLKQVVDLTLHLREMTWPEPSPENQSIETRNETD
jgi:hypothetical protein